MCLLWGRQSGVYSGAAQSRGLCFSRMWQACVISLGIPRWDTHMIRTSVVTCSAAAGLCVFVWSERTVGSTGLVTSATQRLRVGVINRWLMPPRDTQIISDDRICHTYRRSVCIRCQKKGFNGKREIIDNVTFSWVAFLAVCKYINSIIWFMSNWPLLVDPFNESVKHSRQVGEFNQWFWLIH